MGPTVSLTRELTLPLPLGPSERFRKARPGSGAAWLCSRGRPRPPRAAGGVRVAGGVRAACGVRAPAACPLRVAHASPRSQHPPCPPCARRQGHAPRAGSREGPASRDLVTGWVPWYPHSPHLVPFLYTSTRCEASVSIWNFSLSMTHAFHPFEHVLKYGSRLHKAVSHG